MSVLSKQGAFADPMNATTFVKAGLPKEAACFN